MTTDIEKQFFDTFGIEKIIPCYKCNMQNTNWDCKRICLYDDEKRKEYPTITDRILLELLRICLNNDFVIHSKDLAELKEKVLYLLIRNKTPMLQGRIQALFEEG